MVAVTDVGVAEKVDWEGLAWNRMHGFVKGRRTKRYLSSVKLVCVLLLLSFSWTETSSDMGYQ